MWGVDGCALDTDAGLDTGATDACSVDAGPTDGGEPDSAAPADGGPAPDASPTSTVALCTSTCEAQLARDPGSSECLACGKHDCPHNEDLHRARDGCPHCGFEGRVPSIEARELLEHLVELDEGRGWTALGPMAQRPITSASSRPAGWPP